MILSQMHLWLKQNAENRKKIPKILNLIEGKCRLYVQRAIKWLLPELLPEFKKQLGSSGNSVKSGFWNRIGWYWSEVDYNAEMEAENKTQEPEMEELKLNCQQLKHWRRKTLSDYKTVL